MTTRHPTAFLSYAWEGEAHKAWVRELATRLRTDGVAVLLDQWELHPGDSLTDFMERGVRDCDFVLIVCTPAYKKRSNEGGGVKYEREIMTAEVLTSANRRKFIPLYRAGERWIDAAPTWLLGAYYIELRADPYRDEHYQDLLRTLQSRRLPPPPVPPLPEGVASVPPTPAPEGVAITQVAVPPRPLAGSICIEAGHTRPYERSCFLSDGRLLTMEDYAIQPFTRQPLFGHADSAIRIWDVNSQTVVRSIHQDGIPQCVAILSNNRTAVVALRSEPDLRVIDLDTGLEQATLFGHKSEVVHINTVSNDSVVSVSESEILVWSLADRKVMSAIDCESVNRAAVSASSMRAVTVSKHVVTTWDLTDGNIIASWDASRSTYWPRAVAISIDGSQIAACEQETVHVWSIGGQEIWQTNMGFATCDVMFTSDGLLVVTTQAEVLLWDFERGECLRKIQLISKDDAATSATPDRRQFATVVGNEAVLWDVAGTVRRMPLRLHDYVIDYWLSADRASVVVNARRWMLWSLTHGSLSDAKLPVPTDKKIWVSPDGQIIAFERYKDEVAVYSLAARRAVVDLRDLDWPDKVTFSHDGRFVAVLMQKNISVFELPSGTRVGIREGRHVHRAVFDPRNSKRVFLLIEEEGRHSLKAWEYQKPKSLFNLTRFSFAIWIDSRNYANPKETLPVSVAIAKEFVAVQVKHRVMIYSSQNGQHINTWYGDYSMWRIIVSTNEKWIACFADKGVVNFHRARSGEYCWSLRSSGYYNLQFSDDGRFVFAEARDASIQIWDFDKQEEIGRMMAFRDNEWVFLTPDGFYNGSPGTEKYLALRRGGVTEHLSSTDGTGRRNPDVIRERLRRLSAEAGTTK